jgi:hypothetical protein
MLTKADDYPIHQTPEPIAYSGTDRNFYDRYFFNGHTKDGETFFGVALGVYPHLNVMDAAFSVAHEGVQRNLNASRCLHMERLDTRVGPIAVDVVEPLRQLRVRVDSPEHGIRADLLFTARAQPIEEPRFLRRIGPRTFMDYTRLTQHGTYTGSIEIEGKKIPITADRHFGVRDRSWGIRPVGMRDPQPEAPPVEPQFYWLWAPLHFDDRVVLYDVAAHGSGEPWHTSGFVVPAGEGEPEQMLCADSETVLRSGTRHARSATLRFERKNGSEIEIALEPLTQFYMTGLGYFSPEWSHGVYKGELEVGFDQFELAKVDETVPVYQHIQAVVRARYREGSVEKIGSGVLEQLILGAYTPLGLREMFDMAP